MRLIGSFPTSVSFYINVVQRESLSVLTHFEHLELSNSRVTSASTPARKGQYTWHILLEERLQERHAYADDAAIKFDRREDACFAYIVGLVGIANHTIDVDDTND